MSDGIAASAARLVSSTRCPRAPDGDLSDATSTIVNTPRNPTRFGCLCTAGISIAIDSSDNPIFCLLTTKYFCRDGACPVSADATKQTRQETRQAASLQKSNNPAIR